MGNKSTTPQTKQTQAKLEQAISLEQAFIRSDMYKNMVNTALEKSKNYLDGLENILPFDCSFRTDIKICDNNTNPEQAKKCLIHNNKIIDTLNEEMKLIAIENTKLVSNQMLKLFSLDKLNRE